MKTCETCKDDSCFDMGSQRSACDAYAPDADEVENVEDPLAATTATVTLIQARLDFIESRLDRFDNILAAVLHAATDEGEWG